MLDGLKEMLGMKPGVDLRELVKNGAQIVDVRTREEFKSGHLKGSVNIPLQELNQSMNKIVKTKPVVVCCASGMRSSSAKSILKSNGYDAHNGGGWQSLESKIS